LGFAVDIGEPVGDLLDGAIDEPDRGVAGRSRRGMAHRGRWYNL